MTTKTLPFDAAKYLDTEEAQNELIVDAVASGDSGYIAAALGAVTRARGVAKVAAEAGVTREALYKGLGPNGDPRLSTLLGIFRALGLEMNVTPRS